MKEPALLGLCVILLGSPVKAQALDENVEVSVNGAVYIQSPNYPGDYPNNEDRGWIIQTKSEGYVIDLRTRIFRLEYEDNCLFDYVQLYDGEDDSAPFLGRWCGVTGPSTQSTGPSMFVTFHSDARGTNMGFKFYISVQQPYVHFTTSYVGPTIGVVITIVVLLIILLIGCVFYRRRKSITNDQTPINLNRRNDCSNEAYDNVLSVTSFPDHIGSAPPPSYDEAVKHDPPPYCEVVSASGIHPS
ncbi:CUB domain-containing protein 2-like [Haliotis asinina]|uniref:CUB domain-containing protein 2-like n=1 Tax=Haliotis asinina TaxID=109174 RepID=UPI003531CB58